MRVRSRLSTTGGNINASFRRPDRKVFFHTAVLLSTQGKPKTLAENLGSTAAAACDPGETQATVIWVVVIVKDATLLNYYGR